MISSSSSSSPSSSSPSASRKKPRPGPHPQPQNKWRTGAQERIYGRRLLEALRSARAGRDSAAGGGGARVVKEAADSALALTARGQSRWSRAILFGRCRRRKLLLKAGGKIWRRRTRPARKAAVPPPPPAALKGKKVRDRLRVLSRLVPGCRKLSAPSLLEEAVDYVAALEMQVKAMRALADALSVATLSLPSPAAATPEPEN
ncbi:transcription factor bHLH149-like [Cocos nucifera]|uniref:Transcription factor bHLH149-like n=1 Tax=Cocos nucifera TaxID=13894 RepID=A0A8K0I3R9_COCNU|nr:transcription factor bHLH149-like [Cocos nucifera]